MGHKISRGRRNRQLGGPVRAAAGGKRTKQGARAPPASTRTTTTDEEEEKDGEEGGPLWRRNTGGGPRHAITMTAGAGAAGEDPILPVVNEDGRAGAEADEDFLPLFHEVGRNLMAESTAASSSSAAATRTPTTSSINSGEAIFPMKLFHMLNDAADQGFNDIVSWGHDPNSFNVHNKAQFADKILPKYFKMTKYKSFTRQLHNYEFMWIRRGPDKGGYRHKFFKRDGRSLNLLLTRKQAGSTSHSVPLLLPLPLPQQGQQGGSVVQSGNDGKVLAAAGALPTFLSPSSPITAYSASTGGGGGGGTRAGLPVGALTPSFLSAPAGLLLLPLNAQYNRHGVEEDDAPPQPASQRHMMPSGAGTTQPLFPLLLPDQQPPLTTAGERSVFLLSQSVNDAGLREEGDALPFQVLLHQHHHDGVVRRQQQGVYFEKPLPPAAPAPSFQTTRERIHRKMIGITQNPQQQHNHSIVVQSDGAVASGAGGLDEPFLRLSPSSRPATPSGVAWHHHDGEPRGRAGWTAHAVTGGLLTAASSTAFHHAGAQQVVEAPSTTSSWKNDSTPAPPRAGENTGMNKSGH